MQRRQSSIFEGWVSASGQTSASCHDAAVCSVDVFNEMRLDSGAQFYTTPGTIDQRFNASTEPLEIYNDIYYFFEASGRNISYKGVTYPTLAWNNAAFANGTARFCAMTGGVRAYFNGTLPPDCLPVDLGVLPCMYKSALSRFWHC